MVFRKLLLKSHTENVFFWFDECEELGDSRDYIRDINVLPVEWRKAEYAGTPNEEDLFTAIAAGMGNTTD